MVPGPHALPGLGQAQPHWHHVKGVGATFMALGWGMGSPGPPHPRAIYRGPAINRGPTTPLSRSVNVTPMGDRKRRPYISSGLRWFTSLLSITCVSQVFPDSLYVAISMPKVEDG